MTTYANDHSNLSREADTEALKPKVICVSQVRPGDVLIVGSDGLWDNLSAKQILEEVGKSSTLSNHGSAPGVGC